MPSVFLYLCGGFLCGIATVLLTIRLRARKDIALARRHNSPAAEQSRGELVRFRVAADMSTQSIYITDRATMRFVDFNEAAVRKTGYSRQQLLQMGPQDLIAADPVTVERLLDSVIAAGKMQ